MAGEAEFVWIGDGLQAAKEAWLDSPALTITGWLGATEIQEEFAKSDVYVSTASWEAMPLALIEAQAAGLPAVVSDVDGNNEVVVPGETGTIVSDNDNWVAAVRKMLTDPAKLRSMSHAAQLAAEARYSTKGRDYAAESLAIYSRSFK